MEALKTTMSRAPQRPQGQLYPLAFVGTQDKVVPLKFGIPLQAHTVEDCIQLKPCQN